MISVSANFATAITGVTREIRAYLDFNSGTIFRGADGLISIRFENSLMDEDRVSVGCACSSYVVCEWFNKLTGVSLANSYFDAYIGVVESYAQSKPVGSIEDDTAVVEYVKLGRFWITDIERGKATTKVTAYDAMSKASGEYSPTVTAGVNGYSVPSIISDICTQTGITWTSSGSAYVDKIYESTGREQLGWLCSVLYGDGSSFVIDRTTGDLTAVNFVKSVADGTIDDTTIYLDGVEDKPTFTVGSVEMGTDEVTYTAGSGVGISKFNPYATQTLVDSIYADVNGMSFTPMKLHFRGDPRIEVGDLLSVTTDSNTYSVTVMKQTLTFNGGLECTLECFGDLEAHYIMSKSPTEAQIQRTNTVVAEMAEALENADNGIITTIKDADGYPTELLILNSMDKDTATSVWRWNINGLGHTNAYNGGTYNFALDDQGRINASMLIIGTITDQQGYNSWNLDTGTFTITNGSINITTNQGTADKIILTYDGMGDVPPGIFTTAMRATGFRTATEYDPSPSVSQHYYTNVSGREGLYSNFVSTSGGYDNKLLVNAGGGASGDNYYTTLSSSMLQFLDSTTKKILELGSNSSASKYGYINLYDATSPGVKTVNISGNDGAVSLTNPNQVQTLTIKPVINSTAISLYNGTSKYSFLVWPDSNGAGRVVLGDGTSNLWRTELTNSGLTFRDLSDVVTASYPSYGLYAQDMGSRNLANMTVQTTTSNGVTFTVNSNGSISMSGTSSAAFNVTLGEVTLKAGHKYYLTGANGGSNNLYLYFSSSTDGVCADQGSGSSEYTATVDGTYGVRVLVNSSGTNTTGKVFWPMVRESKITDTTYYPYAMTNRELTEQFSPSGTYPITPQTASTDSVIPVSGRGSVSDGGVYKWGRTAFVNLKFTASTTATNSPQVITAPNAICDSALSCIDITNGIASAIEEAIPCGVATNGRIYMKKITSGHIYAITGTYGLSV